MMGVTTGRVDAPGRFLSQENEDGPGRSRFSAKEWADTLEQGIVLNLLEIRQERQEAEEEEQREAERQQKILEYNRWWMEVYYLFKRMPEAADPNSEIGAQVMAMKKELRKLRGRRRGR